MRGLDAWGAAVLGPMPGGGRSRLWRVEICGVAHVAREGAACEPSLRWLWRLQAVAARAGVRLASMVPSQSGALTVAGWTVEPWLEGTPGVEADLPGVRRALRRMHRATRDWPERPGPVRRAPVRLPGVPERAAVHGDVHVGNLVRLAGGGVALIDWEEARIGDPRLDLGFSRDAAGQAAHSVAEVQACWWAEPQRARRMARRLRMFRT